MVPWRTRRMLWEIVPPCTTNEGDGAGGSAGPVNGALLNTPPPRTQPCGAEAVALLPEIVTWLRRSGLVFARPAPRTIAVPLLLVAVTWLPDMVLSRITARPDAPSRMFTTATAAATPSSLVTTTVLPFISVRAMTALPSASRPPPLPPSTLVLTFTTRWLPLTLLSVRVSVVAESHTQMPGRTRPAARPGR